MRLTEFEVEGVHGLYHATKLREALTSLVGIESVAVEWKPGDAKAHLRVKYDERQVKPGVITTRLRELGFKTSKGDDKTTLRLEAAPTGCAC